MGIDKMTKDNKENKETKQTELSEDKPAEHEFKDEDIQVQSQEENITQGKIEVIDEDVQNSGKVTESEPKRELSPFESKSLHDKHYLLAKTIHSVGRNLVSVSTDGGVEIQDDDLEELNNAGAQLLNKYDKDGKLAEYSPEIAYGMTLASITTQVMAFRKEKKRENDLREKELQHKLEHKETVETSPDLPPARG
ncbi:MAG: hypothetical protein ACOCUR_00840 [Nanoarchaeota archaeon]